MDETDPATGRTILKIRYSPASAEILYNIWCGRNHGTHFTATSGLANLYWSDSIQRAGETKKADLYLVRNYSYVNGAYIYVDDYTHYNGDETDPQQHREVNWKGNAYMYDELVFEMDYNARHWVELWKYVPKYVWKSA